VPAVPGPDCCTAQHDLAGQIGSRLCAITGCGHFIRQLCLTCVRGSSSRVHFNKEIPAGVLCGICTVPARQSHPFVWCLTRLNGAALMFVYAVCCRLKITLPCWGVIEQFCYRSARHEAVRSDACHTATAAACLLDWSLAALLLLAKCHNLFDSGLRYTRLRLVVQKHMNLGKQLTAAFSLCTCCSA
jgi:hypothetical protein